jgi:AsmA protein
MNKRAGEVMIKTFVKIPLYLVLGLVFVVLAAALVLPLVFDPDDYRAEILGAVRKHSGRELVIESDMQLHVLPKLAVSTGRIRLNNRSGFGLTPFATADKAYFQIKFLPLLSGRLEIKKIVLNGLKINLKRRKDGQTNWDNGVEQSVQRQKLPIPLTHDGAGSEPIKPSNRFLTASIMATKVDVLNTEITLEDELSGNRVEVRDLDFVIDSFLFNKGFSATIQGTLNNRRPRFRQTSTIRFKLFLNDSLDQVRIENFRWSSLFEGAMFPREFSQIELQTTADFNLNDKLLSLSGLRLNIGPISLGADLSVSWIADKPTISGTVSLEKVSPRELMKIAEIRYPPVHGNSLESLEGKLKFEFGESQLTVRDMALLLDENPVKGHFTVTGLGPGRTRDQPGEAHESIVEFTSASSQTTYQGALNFSSLTLNGLLAEQIQVAFQGTPDVVRINQRVKKFYDGQFTGSVVITLGPRPSVSLSQALTGVRIGPLLQDLGGQTPIDGNLQATISLFAQTTNMNEFSSTLKGNIEAILSNGQVHGIDLLGLVSKSKATAEEGATKPQGLSSITRFDKLDYRASITNGIVTSTLLRGTSPLFDLDGKGTIDLPNNEVSFRLNLAVKKNTLTGPGVQISKLNRLRVPIRVSGTLSSLNYQIDARSVMEDPRVREATRKLEQKIHKKFGIDVEGMLDQLF